MIKPVTIKPVLIMPDPDHLAVAIRTYADHGQYKPFPEQPHITSKYALIFDCETTTDETQTLRFGCFQLRENENVLNKGLFFDPLSLGADEFALLSEYAVKYDLVLLNVDEFVESYIYKFGYDLGASIIGLNLPFDLSRIAKSWGIARKSMKGGFTFRLSDDKRRPNIAIKHLSSRMALIRFVGPFLQRQGRGTRKRKQSVAIERGTFIDLRTLAAALLSGSYSLGKLSILLKVQNPKLDVDEHGGPLMPEYISYALQDVQATWECFVALKQKYEAQNLSTPLSRIMSEAGLGKAYLSQMVVKPWRQCQADFPPHLTGKILSAYYGGRTEVHIRRKVERVIYCDVLSMYPTVCTKMGLWKFVIADGMTHRDGTDEIRKLLTEITPNDFKKPEIWRKLNAVVRVKPKGDLFPVRAEYMEGAGTSIGLNYLTSEQPLYFTLADCIVSKMLTGKVPEIEEAIIFEPGPPQSGLKSVEVGGQADCLVDPYADDFYKMLIEMRQKVKAKLKTALPDEKAQLDQAQLALKIVANSSSYGIFVEINVRDELNKRSVTCYGPSEAVEALSKKTEQPGKYFHPLLATLITGAARLLLALIEHKVQEAGLDWVLCDTDSMAIARPNGMAEAEFIEKTKAVCAWFDALNPYASGGPLLKIEDDNFSLGNPKAIEELFCFAVSSKRYALFNLVDGRPVIRKVSAHGLGHLLQPYNSMNPSKNIPPPKVDLGDARLWHHDLWYQIIMAELEGRGAEVDLAWHPALQKPAISQYRASNPGLLAWFKTFNVGKDYRTSVKPFNFLFTLFAGNDSLRNTVKAVAPYDKDHDLAFGKAFDRMTGKPVNLDSLKNYAEALAQYHLHPEAKFHGGNYVDQGHTLRRHVHALPQPRYIGKEADRIEERFFGVVGGTADIVYNGANGSKSISVNQLSSMAKGIKFTEIARQTGLSAKHVSNLINGRTKGSGSTARKLIIMLKRNVQQPD